MKPTTRFLCISVMLVLLSIVMDGCMHKGSQHFTIPPPPLPPNTVAPTALGDQITFTDQRILVSEKNQPVWLAEVKSGRSSNAHGTTTLTLHGVTSHMYKAGKELLRVTADSATAVVIGKVVHTKLLGHILATDLPPSQRLTAETFTWVSTEDHVQLQQFHWLCAGSSLSADQGTFSTDLTEATFHGHVRMESHGIPRLKGVR